MASQQEINKLKALIKKEMQLCDSLKMPYICSVANDPEYYQETEQEVLSIIAKEKCNVATALLQIERKYNRNMAD
jgi:hypothetical protein